MVPNVGATLGVTVTTCGGPPLVTTTDAVTVHVDAELAAVVRKRRAIK